MLAAAGSLCAASARIASGWLLVRPFLQGRRLEVGETGVASPTISRWGGAVTVRRATARPAIPHTLFAGRRRPGKRPGGRRQAPFAARHGAPRPTAVVW